MDFGCEFCCVSLLIWLSLRCNKASRIGRCMVTVRLTHRREDGSQLSPRSREICQEVLISSQSPSRWASVPVGSFGSSRKFQVADEVSSRRQGADRMSWDDCLERRNEQSRCRNNPNVNSAGGTNSSGSNRRTTLLR